MRTSFPGQGKINLIISSMMLLVFFGLGYLFLATNTWIDLYPKPNRLYIGGVLVAWALFRGITIWIKFNRMKNDNEK